MDTLPNTTVVDVTLDEVAPTRPTLWPKCRSSAIFAIACTPSGTEESGMVTRSTDWN